MEGGINSKSNGLGLPQKGILRYLQIWIYDTGHFETQQGTLLDQNVLEWLASTGEYSVPQMTRQATSVTSSLRLIYCPIRKSPFQLGLDPQVYKHLQSALNLHPFTKEAILNNNGAFGSFYDAEMHVTDKAIPIRFILKVPNSVNIGYDAISSSYDPSTGITNGFIHGSSVESWERIIDGIKSSLPLCSHPSRVPEVLFQQHLKNTEQYRAKIDNSLFKIEREMGYAVPGLLRGDLAPHQLESAPKQDLNLETVVKWLYSMNTELATLGNVTRFRIECSGMMIKTIQELSDKFTGTSKQMLTQHGERIMQQIEYQKNASICLLSQSQALKERVQSHINLTFSLIAQEENRISRSMAMDSALIAVATRRDSTAMKTIAIISIFFLPATFVATFFSMTFFDWGASSGSSPTVSPYMWVYWAISIPLTTVVYFTWRVWWTLEEQKFRKEAAAARDKHGRGFSTATSYLTAAHEELAENGSSAHDSQFSSLNHIQQFLSLIRGMFKRDRGRDKEFKEV